MLNKKAMAASPSAGTTTDPDFEYVTMLLHGDGTNGGQNNTFTDGSTNNFTITRNGNTTQGTFSPYAPGWSNYFDGSGDYLTAPDNSAWSFNSDFTVETWAYPINFSAERCIVAQWYGGSIADTALNINFQQNTGTVRAIIAIGSTQYTLTSASSYTANSWHHIALVRSGSTLTLYVNGVSAATTTASGTTNDIGYPLSIGGLNALGSYTSFFLGYISNVRIVKGTAVYTGTFTPPTSALTAVTNTQLLTCQSNRFIDNSSNGFTITSNGDVRVQPFNPFSPAAAYSTGTNGGSGYFDGNGDWLNRTTGSAFDFGSSDYTVEYWLFLIGDIALNGYGNVAGPHNTTANGIGFGLTYRNGRNEHYASSLTTPYTTNVECQKSTWNHVAWVRNGTSVQLYVNGQLQATLSITNNYTDTGISIGGVGSNYYINGYISDLRVVNGSRVYTAAFTPPTAPLTAITNTSLLLNFTNGAIIDNAMDNVLETVGNAQISTSVKKFGTGSLSFDGTGDWLAAPDNPNLELGSGDFTIECWAYFNALPASLTGAAFVTKWNSGNYSFITAAYNNSGTMQLYFGYSTNGSSTSAIMANASITTSTWYHIAFVRSGSSFKMFLNGTEVTSSATLSGTLFNGAEPLAIGRTGDGFNYINGYIDDLRITRGVARYTANFTPPTAAFPDL